MSTKRLVMLNLWNLFKNWTLIAWGLFLLIPLMLIVPVMGFVGRSSGWHSGQDGGFPLFMSLLYNLSAGFQFCSAQMQILTRPFAFMLSKYTKVAFLSMVLLAVALNGLCVLLVLLIVGPKVSPALIYFVAGIFIFGVGVFVFPLWHISHPGSNGRYLFVLFALSGGAARYLGTVPNQITNPLVLSSIGCVLLFMTYRRLQDPDVIRSFVGRTDVLSSAWDKKSVEEMQRSLEKSALQKRQGLTVLEKVSDIFFRRSHDFNPIPKLLAGMQYMVTGRVSVKQIVTMTMGGAGFAVVLYYTGGMEGRAFVDSLYALVVSLCAMTVVLGLFNIPAYYYQLPESRRNKWRAVALWNLFRACVACLLVFVSMLCLSILTDRLQATAPSYLYDPLRHLIGQSSVPLFGIPMFVLLELWVEPVVLRTIGMIAIFAFWPGIPLLWPPYTSLFVILALEWTVMLLALKHHGLRADLTSNKRAGMWGWAQ